MVDTKRGIVKLSRQWARRVVPVGLSPLSERGSCLGDVVPNCEGALPRSAPILGGCMVWIGKVKEVCNLIVNGQETLRLSGRFEALHDPFASPCRQMRILRSIVKALMLAMLDPKTQLCPRRTIRSKLVRDHHAWRRDGGFQELGHEPQRSAAISSTLDQDVENEAILIDRAPQPVLLASDRNDEASGAGESHPRALSEPDVTLSRHPAPIVRPRPWIKLQ